MNKRKRTFKKRILILALFTTTIAFFAQNLDAQKPNNPISELESTFLIQNVIIINVKDGQMLSNHSILVSDGKIESILSAKELDNVDLYQTIDAKGSFVIPGLWDMHAHLRANNLPPELITDWMMPLILGNGVTGVREMTSSCQSDDQGPVCLEQMREWQNNIKLGTLDGPRLLALSTFQLNSPPKRDYNKEEIKQMVETFDEQNVDLIKIYTGLSPRAFNQVMKEARKYNIPAGGHVPLRVTISEASNKGFRSLEHARDFLFDCFPGSKSFRKSAKSQDPPISVMHDMVDQFEEKKCQGIFQVMIDNDTWYVPTHLTRRMEAFADDIEFLNDSRNQYIPKFLLESWNRDAARVVAIDTTKYGRYAYLKFYRKGLEITGKAHDAGVRILVGTDGGDSFAYPGFGVHDELEELVKAGLTPLEAIQAATIDSAEFLNLQTSFGSIEVGKKADFLLLDYNPLIKIENTQGIRAVVYRGEYLDRNELNSLLGKAEKFEMKID